MSGESYENQQDGQVSADIVDMPMHEEVPDIDPVIISEAEVEHNGTPRRNLRSVMWNHFKRQKINGEYKCVCNYYGKRLGGKIKSGTKHLHDHFKICPLRRQKNVKAMLKATKTVEGKVKIDTYSFDQESSQRELANMIILHEYPLSMVEHIGFRRFLSSVQPLFKVVSRNTIKNDILMIYDYEKSKTMSLLESNESRIAITTDMWTCNNQKKGFMAITAHFIDESWKLQSRIIRYFYVKLILNYIYISMTKFFLISWIIFVV